MKAKGISAQRLRSGLSKSMKKSAMAFGLSLFTPIAVSASCYSGVADERLANFCALDSIEGAIVGVRSLYFIDYKLKLEGSEQGLGFPTLVDKSAFSTHIYPVISYSGNINGGNPPSPLVVGDLTFQGDEQLYLKDGFTLGLGSGFDGRYIYGDRQYLSYSADASYAYSPEHGIGISSTSANVCSHNYLVNSWYIDVCGNAAHVQKELINSTDSNFSISSAKLISNGENVYSQLKLGINRYFSESYNQDQITFGVDTLLPSGTYSEFNVMLGEAIENNLATVFSVSAQLSMQIESKPFTISGSASSAEGGLLLGVDRSEITYSVTASYPIWRNLRANIGYRNTNSNIDYFDVKTPTFSIQFKSFNF